MTVTRRFSRLYWTVAGEATLRNLMAQGEVANLATPCVAFESNGMARYYKENAIMSPHTMLEASSSRCCQSSQYSSSLCWSSALMASVF